MTLILIYNWNMILDTYISFLDKLLEEILQRGIDVSKYELDHISYQANSNNDYDKLFLEFKKLGTQVFQTSAGGRRESIFKFKNPLIYKHYTISAFELLEPKKDQKCISALEHAEFVINRKFEDFMKLYPLINNWDITAINRPGFAMLKLKLTKDTQVKFHHTPILQIIDKLNEK